MNTWRTIITSTGFAVGILCAIGAAPLSAEPRMSAAPAPVVEAGVSILNALLAPAVVEHEAETAGVHKAGYYARPGWRHRRHGWRKYRRGPRRGKVVIIERPCSTRIVRRTPRGKVVRVIRHCDRYGYRPHW